MSIKKCCTGLFLLMLCSGSAIAADDKLQFPKTGNGDTEYLWQHGRDSFRSAAEVETGYLSYIPAVLILVVGAVVFERMREKRRENEWRNEETAEGVIEPLVSMEALPAEDGESASFQPITTEELWRFTRPSLGLEVADTNLQVPNLQV